MQKKSYNHPAGVEVFKDTETEDHFMYLKPDGTHKWQHWGEKAHFVPFNKPYSEILDTMKAWKMVRVPQFGDYAKLMLNGQEN